MNIKSVLILLIVSLVLISADHFRMLEVPKSIFGTLFVPVQIGLDRTVKKITYELNTITEIGRIRDRNRDLEYNSALLSAENIKLKALESENKILREQLQSKIKTKLLTPVNTIGFSQIGGAKYLMIDQGSNNGVRRDQLVVLNEILIGKIEAVGPVSANIILTTHPEFKIPANTQRGTKGLAVGRYQQEVRLTKILPEEKVEVGDQVQTSGEAGFPKGLIIGKVEEVFKSDKDIFQEAKVSLLINPEKFSIVFLLE